jgi:hypothetical protein
MSGIQPEELRLTRFDHDHRVPGRTATFGWTPRVHDPRTIRARELGQMGMAVRDQVAGRERFQQTRVSPLRGSCIVDEADAQAFGLRHESRGQTGANDRFVHVPVHRGHQTDFLQILEELGRRQVSDVQDHCRAFKHSYASFGKPPRAPRQMRVSDERDQLGSARKLPSR